jgi:Tol biopolymer transport system component
MTSHFRSGAVMAPAVLAACLLISFAPVHPARAAFPGSTDDIAFVSTRGGGWQIYRMGADGYHPTRLTDTAGLNGDPSWSADGRKVTFTNITFPNNSESSEVFLMDADGSAEINVTNDPALDQRPSWSPSGSAMVFDSGLTGNGDIYRVTLDGTGQPVARTRMTTNAAVDFDPAISPDGRRLAFVSSRGGDENIYVMRSNTPKGPDNRPVRLTRNAAADTRGHPAADRSPLQADGRATTRSCG